MEAELAEYASICDAGGGGRGAAHLSRPSSGPALGVLSLVRTLGQGFSQGNGQDRPTSPFAMVSPEPQLSSLICGNDFNPVVPPPHNSSAKNTRAASYQ